MTDLGPNILCLCLNGYDISTLTTFATDLKPAYDNQFPWQKACWTNYSLNNDVLDSSGDAPFSPFKSGTQTDAFFQGFDIVFVPDTPLATLQTAATNFTTILGFFKAANKGIAGIGNGIALAVRAGAFTGAHESSDTPNTPIPVAGTDGLTGASDSGWPTNVTFQANATDDAVATTNGGVVLSSKTDTGALAKIAANVIAYKNIHP